MCFFSLWEKKTYDAQGQTVLNILREILNVNSINMEFRKIL